MFSEDRSLDRLLERDHERILKEYLRQKWPEGIDRWNRWRSERPGLAPMLGHAFLAGADLVRANLAEAVLTGADLNMANLSRGDLSDADLAWARLREADLIDATLVRAILDRSDLTQADLKGANLQGAYLGGANLADADLCRVDLSGADLRDADFLLTDLKWANLTGANLTNARFRGADLRGATLTGANLTNASLGGSLGGTELNPHLDRDRLMQGLDPWTLLEPISVIPTKLDGACLDGCRVWGIAAWDITLDEQTSQENLIITPTGQNALTVDDLGVAQFMYLLLENKRIRKVIDTITSKVVLILGRFKVERKKVLDALRSELRRHNLTPILFDFDIPTNRDITETVTLLARMARFIVADLTDPASIPMELQAIAPDVAVPIRSLVQKGQRPFSMFKTLKKYHWVLPPYQYSDMDELLANLQDEIIAPAEAKRIELKAEQL